MSDATTRPVRGGLAIVIVLLVAGGIAILSFAPGGWGALPLVRYFADLSAFGLGVCLAAPIVLTVVVLAVRNARRWKGLEVATPPRGGLWTTPRFVAALVATPPFLLAGGWLLLRGHDELLVGNAWRHAYVAMGVLLSGLWLASSFHAFHSLRRILLWVLAGGGIALSFLAVRASGTVLDGPFLEQGRVRLSDGVEYVLCSQTKARLPGFDYLDTSRLCRVRWSLLGLTRCKTLVETQTAFTDYGVYPEFGRLVRPEGFSSDRGFTLYASEDGFIACVFAEMECVLAFDTTSGQAYGEWHDPDPDWKKPGSGLGHLTRKGMESLPPFRLVEAGGRPDPGDVGILEAEAARRAKELQPGQSTVWYEGLEGLGWATRESSLLHALESRNALVRAAATRIIRAGGKALYPEAYEKAR